MPELYIFIVATIAIVIIVTRRNVIWSKEKRLEFKKEVAKKVDELKKMEEEKTPERFREKLQEQKLSKKYDIAGYKKEIRAAEMAIARENFSEAKKHLINAISLAQDEFGPSLLLADVYLMSGDLKRAETLFKELLEIDSNTPKIYESLGKIYQKQKKYKEAIQMYARAAELDEKNDKILIALGKLYYLLMRYSIAGECYRRAAEIRPREVKYLFLLAECCAKDMDYENALFTYERILTLEPYNDKAKQAAIDMKNKISDMESAMAT